MKCLCCRVVCYVSLNTTPPQLVINLSQTGLTFSPAAGSRAQTLKLVRAVPFVGQHDRQITGNSLIVDTTIAYVTLLAAHIRCYSRCNNAEQCHLCDPSEAVGLLVTALLLKCAALVRCAAPETYKYVYNCNSR